MYKEKILNDMLVITLTWAEKIMGKQKSKKAILIIRVTG